MPETSRRDFLKLATASAGAVAASGCYDHVEKLIPYVVQPEEITPGIPVVYASTCQECPVACGVHVKTREGRPIKVEGNPEHPINQGRLCARAQASVGRTYHPDRYQGPMRRGESGALEKVSWEDAIATIRDAIQAAPGRTHVLGGNTGDTLSALVDRIVSATGAGGRTIYEPFSNQTLREASRKVFGVASEPIFDVSGADLVIDFGSEMLESGISPVEHQRVWAAARDLAAHADGGARLVYIGPRLSLTASSSDEWLPAIPGSEGLVAAAIARVAIENGAGGGAHRGLLSGALASASVDAAATASGLEAEQITRLGKAVAHAKSAVALPPGVAVSSRRAIAATSAVLLLNDVAGSVGGAVRIPPADDAAHNRASYRDVLALGKAMDAGEVDVLLVHDSNPVYSLPKASGFQAALAKVKLVVSFASIADETSEQAHLVLPDHAPLESWGDAAPRNGIRGLVQPTLRPLYDTRALGDSLLDVARALGDTIASQLPSGSFRGLVEAAWAGAGLRRSLKKGGAFAASAQASVGAANAAGLELAAPKFTGSGDFTLVAFPHSMLGDGSGAALPILQEIPDPVTSIAWDSWAEVSLATAEKLDVETGDLLAIETSAGKIEVPAYIRGGIRDDVVAVPIGQGHTVGRFASKAGQGLPGTARGVNVGDALPGHVDESGAQAWLTEKATVTATGRHRRLPVAQPQDNKRERQLGEVITLAQFLEDEPAAAQAGHGEPAAAAHGGGHEAPAADAHGGGHDKPHEIREPYDPADDSANQQLEDEFLMEKAIKASEYRWGMTVDIDKCTGCSACIAACYVENNIPVIGEDESRRARQMAWIRIDRFPGEGDRKELIPGRALVGPNHEKLGDSDVRNAPMFCQQCGAAPCEPVCPVFATYHNEDGLNAMIYNRCIGTRYCANNCPYKVRRYNYFDNQITKWHTPMELGLNPDVTVRGQGVMEKCTFCIQRIQYARQESKNAGEERIEDGAVQTACQQTCPSGAITFGNLRDDESVVSKTADDPKRGYHALHVLNTRPSVTYLAKVVRGPVEG